MGPEDDPLDDDWGGPPPELVDRVWRHPSEIAAAQRLAAEQARAEVVRRRRTLVLSAAGGFVITCGVLVVGLQALERDPERPGEAVRALTQQSVAAATDAVDAGSVVAAVPLAGAATSVASSALTAANDLVDPTDETTGTTAVTVDDDGLSMATLVHPDDASSLAAVRIGEDERTCVQVTEHHAAMAMEGALLVVGDVVDGPSGPMRVVHIDADRAIAVLSGAAATPITLRAVGLGDTVVGMTDDGVRTGQVIDLAAQVDTAGGVVGGAMLTNITVFEAGHDAVLTDTSGNVIALTLQTDHTLVAAVPMDVVARVVRSVEAEVPTLGWAVGADRTGAPIVTSLDADGPAAVAGVELGDLVEYVDGHPIADLLELDERLHAAADDAEVEVIVRRDGDGTKRTRHRLVVQLLTDSPA